MSNPRYRKRPISPSTRQHPTATSTTPNRECQPLFLPDPDEDHGPSMSTRTPLFLPEEERERPKRKKRRISSKVIQSKTLVDLWRPRQVSSICFILTISILTSEKTQPHNQQDSSPFPPIPGPSSSRPIPSSLPQRRKKQSLPNRLGRIPGMPQFTSSGSHCDKDKFYRVIERKRSCQRVILITKYPHQSPHPCFT